MDVLFFSSPWFKIRFSLNVALVTSLIVSYGCSGSYDKICIDLNIPEWSSTWVQVHVIKSDGEYTDSVMLDESGEGKLVLHHRTPVTFAFAGNGNDHPLVLVANPGERVKVSYGADWQIQGSLESIRLMNFQKKILSALLHLQGLKVSIADSLTQRVRDSIYSTHTLKRDSILSLLRNEAYATVSSNPYDISSIFILISRLEGTPILPYNEYKQTYTRVDSCLSTLYPYHPLLEGLKKVVRYFEFTDSLALQELSCDVGKTIPQQYFTTIDERVLQVPGIWARWILLDFWNPRFEKSGYDRAKLKSVYQNYGPQGLVVISFGVGMDSLTLAKHAITDSITWYQVELSEVANSDLLKSLGIARLPANLLLNRSGVVEKKNIDYSNLAHYLDSSIQRVSKPVLKAGIEIAPTK